MFKKIKLPSWLKLPPPPPLPVVCLWYVSNKINWGSSLRIISSSHFFWLIAATIFFVASKLVSAFRLNIYFTNIQVYLGTGKNIFLYWLGMFYNLFLPGGIGGDAYKVILLNRRYNHPVKLLGAAVLLDRISGVAGLGILAVTYFYLIHQGNHFSLLLLLAIVPGTLLYFYLVKIIFPSFLKGFWPTLWLGVAVQVLQVICIWCIMNALHISEHHTEYILIFLLSSIVAILPFTIGGLGAREIVFLWGSTQFGLNKEESVGISILFYLITVAISLIGVIWEYKDPLKE